MKRSKFTEAQIAFILRQGEEGTAVGEICRKAGISISRSRGGEGDAQQRSHAISSPGSPTDVKCPKTEFLHLEALDQCSMVLPRPNERVAEQRPLHQPQDKWQN
jgi:hypothetical protein